MLDACHWHNVGPVIDEINKVEFEILFILCERAFRNDAQRIAFDKKKNKNERENSAISHFTNGKMTLWTFRYPCAHAHTWATSLKKSFKIKWEKKNGRWVKEMEALEMFSQLNLLKMHVIWILWMVDTFWNTPKIEPNHLRNDIERWTISRFEWKERGKKKGKILLISH